MNEKCETFVSCCKPKPGSDGSYPVERVKAISGEKLLRNIMLDNKIELYATYVSLIPHVFNQPQPLTSFAPDSQSQLLCSSFFSYLFNICYKCQKVLPKKKIYIFVSILKI